jgi:hypothetical protein
MGSHSLLHTVQYVVESILKRGENALLFSLVPYHFSYGSGDRRMAIAAKNSRYLQQRVRRTFSLGHLVLPLPVSVDHILHGQTSFPLFSIPPH